MPDPTAVHRCPVCKVDKDLSEFAGRKRKSGTPYPSSYCRACQSEYNQRWRELNGEAEAIRRRAKYASDPEWRAARRIYGARRYAENPDANRNNTLMAKFGITLADYRSMQAAQDNRCAICSEPCKSGRQLAVDHDHATGKVRALLCIRCNNGLGNFRDNARLIAGALEYLNEHSQKGRAMPTFYVEDYDGDREPDETAETVEVEKPAKAQAKVVTSPEKPAVKKSPAKVTTKAGAPE